jgi:septal ring factor EnvC (AmiA/AmiB activator)
MRQGLTARDSRVVQLARAAVQLDGDRRQITAYIARARQEIARIEQTRSSTETQRHLEISSGIKEVDDSLAALRITLDEVRSGLAELRETLPSANGPLNARSVTAYSILRVRGSPPRRIAAEIDTSLLPGDLVEVITDATGPGRRLAAGSQE